MRSPAFPGNLTPVGIPLQIRDDAIEAFAAVTLVLPAAAAAGTEAAEATTAKAAAPAAAAARAASEIVAAEADATGEAAATTTAAQQQQVLQVSLTVSGFLNEDPVFFNPYTRLLLPAKQLQQQQQQMQQQQEWEKLGFQPLPSATKPAADVLLSVHPNLSELPEGFLFIQIERRDPQYSSSSSNNSSSSNDNIVHVATIATGREGVEQQQQQMQQQRRLQRQQQRAPSRVLLQTEGEVRVRLRVSVSRILGQGFIASWVPAAAAASDAAAATTTTAAAAAAAAAAAVQTGASVSATAALAGSQHTPQLYVHLNEDFNAYLNTKGGKHPTKINPYMFFPYVRSFNCLLEPAGARTGQSAAAAAAAAAAAVKGSSGAVSVHRKLLLLPDPTPAQQTGLLLHGVINISSLWMKPHDGQTNIQGEFSANKRSNASLLLQVS